MSHYDRVHFIPPKLPPAAAHLAAQQSGVLSREQLIGLGMSSSGVDRAAPGWRKLGRGVYWVTPNFAAPTVETLAWAGILVGGDGSRLGGLTAARLQGLEDSVFRWAGVHPRGEEIVVMVPSNRTPRRREGFLFVRETPNERLRSSHRDPACTRVEDTVLDLCAVGDLHDVLTWLTRACGRRLTTPQRLEQRVRQRHRLKHRTVMLKILADVTQGVTSHLEHEALVHVLRAHAFPPFLLQQRDGGQRIVDVVFRQFRLVVEFDGRLGHEEEGAFRDAERDNDHTVSGFATLRYGWSDVVDRPCAVAAQIAAVLHRNGWQQDITRCRLCELLQSTG